MSEKAPSILGKIQDPKERDVIRALQAMVGRSPVDLTQEQALLTKLLKEAWNVDEKIFGVVIDSRGRVQGLVLHRLGLEALPQDIGNLTRLQVLLAAYNQLKSLPDTFGLLHRLEKLYLHENQLQSLPETFGQLSSLQHLELQYNELKSLPDTFGNLSNLQTLKIYNNQLQSLPEPLLRLTNLQTLDLSGNQLQSLPEPLLRLTNLQTLDLSGNQLQSLPDTFGLLHRLEKLYLGGNQLKSLPDTFRNLSNLQTLSLAGNQLKSLPETFGQLSRLEKLYLHENQLQSLPETFGQLSRLETLWLNNNELQSLPETFGRLSRLEYLDLSRNQLKSLPDTFGQLHRLEKLYLHRNQLKSLPDTFGNLSNLVELYLDANELKSLPDTFGQLSNLQHLELQYNELQSLPDTFGQLSNLQHLELQYNGLKSLPDTFGQLHRLERLDLGDNQLKSLPETFGQLHRLEGLDLSYNQLKSLPDTFGQLSNLQHLELQYNGLKSLPETFGQLSRLQTLDLHGNHLRFVEVTEFVRSGSLEYLEVDDGVILIADLSARPVDVRELPAGLRWKDIQWLTSEDLEAFKRDWVDVWRLKVVLVGEMEMGKTALARAVTREAVLHRGATVVFRGRELSAKDLDGQESENQQLLEQVLAMPRKSDRTVGIDRWILRIPRGDHSVSTGTRKYWEIIFWDFAGHQVYRSAHQPFLTKEGVYLVVFHPKSDRLEDLKVAEWYQRIRSVSDEAPIVYVKTRSNETAFIQQWERIRHEFLEWLDGTGQLKLSAEERADPNTTSVSLSEVFIEVDSDENNPRGVDKLLHKLERLAMVRYPPRRVLGAQHRFEQVIMEWQVEMIERGELGVKTLEEVVHEVKRRLEQGVGVSGRHGIELSVFLRKVLWDMHREGMVLWVNLSGRPRSVVLNVDLMCKAVTGVEILALQKAGRLDVPTISTLAGEVNPQVVGGDLVFKLLLKAEWIQEIVDFGVSTGVFYRLGRDKILVPSALPSLEKVMDDETWDRWSGEFLEKTRQSLSLSRNEEFVEDVIVFNIPQLRENLLSEMLSYLKGSLDGLLREMFSYLEGSLDVVMAWKNGALLSLRVKSRTGFGGADGRVDSMMEVWILLRVSKANFSNMTSKTNFRRPKRRNRSRPETDAEKLGLKLSVVVRGSQVKEIRRQVHVLLFLASAALRLEPVVLLSHQCSACDEEIDSSWLNMMIEKNVTRMMCPSCHEELSLLPFIERQQSDELGSFSRLQGIQEALEKITKSLTTIDQKLDRLIEEFGHVREDLRKYRTAMLDQLSQVDDILSRQFDSFFIRLQFGLEELVKNLGPLITARGGMKGEDEKIEEMVIHVTRECGIALETWFRKHWGQLESRLARMKVNQAVMIRGVLKLLSLRRWDDLPPVVGVEFHQGRLKNVLRAWFGCSRCGTKAPRPVLLDEWRRWVRVTRGLGKAGMMTVYCLVNPSSDVISAYQDVYSQLSSSDDLPELEEQVLNDHLDLAGYEKLRQAFLGTLEVFQWFVYQPLVGWTCHACASSSVVD